jgi:hypothetical protein
MIKSKVSESPVKMKSTTNRCLLVFVVIMACPLTACNNDDAECEQLPIETTSLEALYGCSDTPFGISIPLENDFIILSEQQWYDSLVTGFCQPEIDFENYDLIIGRQQLTKGLEDISYTYVRACPTLRYELRVKFTLDDQTVSPTVTYHVLVPKIMENEAVDLRIEMN